MNKHNYKRITKREAFKLWMEGKEICLHPCNMNFFWMQPMPVTAENYVEHVKMYAEMDVKYPKKEYSIWVYSNEKELYQKAWDIMYNNWAYYNTNYEMGYYAHYYIKE